MFLSRAWIAGTTVAALTLAGFPARSQDSPNLVRNAGFEAGAATPIITR